MNQIIYRYRFGKKLSLRDVEESLFLAVLATEGLHGGARVRLEASFCVDEEKRTCVVDGRTEVGRHLARIFTGFLRQEFGEESFRVERLDPDAAEASRTESRPEPEPAGAA